MMVMITAITPSLNASRRPLVIAPPSVLCGLRRSGGRLLRLRIGIFRRLELFGIGSGPGRGEATDCSTEITREVAMANQEIASSGSRNWALYGAYLGLGLAIAALALLAVGPLGWRAGW